MKNKHFFIILLWFIEFSIHADPLLVAVLMVKNEEPAMKTTLQPLIDAGIKDYLIYDTGSTDHTIQVTQDIFLKNNISNYVIEQGEFVDFSISRNKALELTENHFPDAIFMLMLDAEWVLHGGDTLLEFCMQHKNDSVLLYNIKIFAESIIFYHPRLIRAHSAIQFVGKVHEIPNIQAQAKVIDSVYFQLCATHYGQEKSRQRWDRDIQILLKELEDKPNDGRTLYFLAQTYAMLGNLDLAIDYYKQRLQVNEYNEELFLSYCSLAELYHQKQMDETMITTYLQAFALFPHRAEPLIYLAMYYWNVKCCHLCYIFARFACTITYPSTDVSLIDTYLYRVVRYALVSATAHMFGDYELGLQATKKALHSFPENQYLQEQLSRYQACII